MKGSSHSRVPCFNQNSILAHNRRAARNARKTAKEMTNSSYRSKIDNQHANPTTCRRGNSMEQHQTSEEPPAGGRERHLMCKSMHLQYRIRHLMMAIQLKPALKYKEVSLIIIFNVNVGSSDDFIVNKSKGYEEFMKRKDFGSPIPTNEILLPFKLHRQNIQNKKNPNSPKVIKHHKQPSESSLPQELIVKSDNPMKSSVYKNMTLHIFHSINIIKQIQDRPNVSELQKIDFEFKKEGFKKLIIFDLDETLIHCQREELLSEEDEEDPYKFVPQTWVNIVSP